MTVRKPRSFALLVLACWLSQHAPAVANVYVPQPPSRGVIEVHGAVMTPGTVLLRENELALPEVIHRAGGLAPDAYLLGAILLRKTRNAIGFAGPQDRFCLGGAEQQGLQVLRTAVSSSKSTEVAEAVYKRDLVRISIRLSAVELQSGAQGGVSLVDGDVLIIPPRPAYTYVGGRVGREGPVLYEPGMLAEDYYEAANGTGRGWFSQDVVVLPNGDIRMMKLRFWNYQPTAIPPGSLLLFDVADPACLPVTVRR